MPLRVETVSGQIYIYIYISGREMVPFKVSKGMKHESRLSHTIRIYVCFDKARLRLLSKFPKFGIPIRQGGHTSSKVPKCETVSKNVRFRARARARDSENLFPVHAPDLAFATESVLELFPVARRAVTHLFHRRVQANCSRSTPKPFERPLLESSRMVQLETYILFSKTFDKPRETPTGQ